MSLHITGSVGETTLVIGERGCLKRVEVKDGCVNITVDPGTRVVLNGQPVPGRCCQNCRWSDPLDVNYCRNTAPCDNCSAWEAVE